MAIDVNDIKKKFGLLLNYLVEAGFSFEIIEEKILRDKYFLFLENNTEEDFIKTPLETIIRDVFKKDIYIDYTKEIKSELYWAGEMYITICANKLVPLQRVILLLPIEKMLYLFNPYHEMNASKLVDWYQTEANQESVLKALVIEKSLTIREINELTGINQKTLLSYQDNNKLFKASASNIYCLSNLFNVPACIFIEKSNFIPNAHILLKDDIFTNIFTNNLANYLNVPSNIICLTNSVEDIDKYFENFEIVVDTKDYFIYKKKRIGITKPFLKHYEIDALFMKSINEFKEKIQSGILLF